MFFFDINNNFKMTGTYFDFQPIRRFDSIRKLLKKNELLCSNITNITVSQYIDDLEEFEKKKERNFKDDTKRKAIYGYTLLFLLPEKRKNKSQYLSKDDQIKIVKNITKAIVQQEKSLKWFACIHQKINARYIVIYISDREYYPHSEYARYDKDIYLNRLTKRFCKIDDENAELIGKKGDFKRDPKGNKIRIDITFKQKKAQRFRCKPDQWSNFLKQIHILYRSIIIEKYQILPGFGFDRYDLGDVKDRYQRRIFCFANNVKETIGQLITESLEMFRSRSVVVNSWSEVATHEAQRVEVTNAIPEEIYKKIKGFFNKYDRRFKKGSWHDKEGVEHIFIGARADIAENSLIRLQNEAERELKEIEAKCLAAIKNDKYQNIKIADEENFKDQYFTKEPLLAA